MIAQSSPGVTPAGLAPFGLLSFLCSDLGVSELAEDHLVLSHSLVCCTAKALADLLESNLENWSVNWGGDGPQKLLKPNM